MAIMIIERTKQAFGRILRNESGAVSADFVMLTGLIIVFTLATASAMLGDKGEALVNVITKYVN
ncbi:MAG: hypothetical protein ACWA47_05000 [Brevirhabdus sp.]